MTEPLLVNPHASEAGSMILTEVDAIFCVCWMNEVVFDSAASCVLVIWNHVVSGDVVATRSGDDAWSDEEKHRDVENIGCQCSCSSHGTSDDGLASHGAAVCQDSSRAPRDHAHALSSSCPSHGQHRPCLWRPTADAVPFLSPPLPYQTTQPAVHVVEDVPVSTWRRGRWASLRMKKDESQLF